MNVTVQIINSTLKVSIETPTYIVSDPMVPYNQTLITTINII